MAMSGGSSIRRIDLLSLSNLRNDGRRPNELRRLRIQMGPLGSGGDVISCTGSAVVEMGLTVALARVIGPTAAGENAASDRCAVEVTISVTPFADGGGGRRRNAASQQHDRRLLEMSAYIQAGLESCLVTQLYPQSSVQVAITLLQDDGGRLCAAMNAAMCAVLDAGIPVLDICCACTAGYNLATADNRLAMIDLNRREEAGSGGPGSVVLVSCAVLPDHRSSDPSLVWAACDTGRLPDMDAMEDLVQAAMDGCLLISNQIQTAAREHASSILAARMGSNGIIVQNALLPRNPMLPTKTKTLEKVTLK